MSKILNIYRDDSRAVIPTQGHDSDSGYDVTVIAVHKRLNGSVTLYDTGLIAEPQPLGSFYLDLVARSSLMKHGYMLANNIGIIDTTYRGRIMVALYRFDKQAPDLTLPMRVAQLIPRNIVKVDINEILEEPGTTKRAKGGFGSTNK